MSETVTVPARPADLTTGADKLAAEATRLAAIETQGDAEVAGQFLRGVRERIRRIKQHYKDARSGLDKAYDHLKAMETADLRPWATADATVNAPLLAWLSEDKKRVDAENRRRAEEAEAKAKADRDAQAATLTAAAAAAPTKREQEALQAQARRVAREQPVARDVEVAERVKVTGVPLVTKKVAYVADMATFLRAVAAGKVPVEAVRVNQAFLNSQATKLGDTLRYPGVVVEDEDHIAARGL